MADNGIGIFFVLLEEVICSRKSYLVDVFVNFLGSHTDAAVADGQCAGFFVKLDLNG